jgi:hypothetical protein
MTLPRRAQLALGAGGAVLLGGILGLAWWLWWWRRHRPGCQPVARPGRVRAAVVAGGLLIIAVGAAWRTAIAIEHVPPCSPPGRVQAAARSSPFDASLLAQLAASRAADYYVAVHVNNPVGARAMTLGDVVLSPRFKNVSGERLTALANHEARHRVQWAVATAIGGPLAFPVAYAIDDFFFPGPRNHFERLAGLEEGGYSHEGTGPVLGPAQLTALGVLAAIIIVALLRARHRRASRDFAATTDTAAQQPRA